MKKIFVIVINLFVGLMSFGAWIFMALLTFENGMLTSQGFESLKYFTVLSNLLNGGVSLFYGIRLLAGKKITLRIRILKLAAAAAVGLTFLTIAAFLGPIYGYETMYNGSNFWMHLVLPVASMVSFMFLETDGRIPWSQTLFAMVPTVLYEIGYLTNIGLHGIGTWPETNDFYGFLNWGYGVGAVIAAAMLLVTWGIALMMCCVRNRQEK